MAQILAIYSGKIFQNRQGQFFHKGGLLEIAKVFFATKEGQLHANGHRSSVSGVHKHLVIYVNLMSLSGLFRVMANFPWSAN